MIYRIQCVSGFWMPLLVMTVLASACGTSNGQSTASRTSEVTTPTTSSSSSRVPSTFDVTSSATPLADPDATAPTKASEPTALSAPTEGSGTSAAAAPPPGVAAQVRFGLGAGGTEPSCVNGELVDGVIVYPGTSVELLETSLVCFPELRAEGPVEVVIATPDGKTTPTTANRHASSFGPFIDFTRQPDDQIGTYTIQAVQGANVSTVSISVLEPGRPTIDVIGTDSESAMLAAVAFPPSQQVDVHLYRQHHPDEANYDWVRSVILQTNERGHGLTRVPMTPASPGTQFYGILTSPRAYAPAGRDTEDLTFMWQP